ncbi:MAG: hypothetical protein PHG31_03030 [Candidatus Omnitrophica bacterium]|nr:hypothetical protein [Candidatus Omnitrophota bacterium]
MEERIRLKIADTIISLESDYELETLNREEMRTQSPQRFKNFIYKGNTKPHISIEVKVKKSLPVINGLKNVFISYHPQDSRANWQLLHNGNSFYFRSLIKGKLQLMKINKGFNRVIAYLLPKKEKGSTWNYIDIIYDFLQVLLINYFALHTQGVFVHSIGVKDRDASGLLFAGKSGSGKSTTARIWHAHSHAMVLNDDRIIVRKTNGSFAIYGSPWHGEFSDYLISRIESAALKKLFFIHHAPHNTVRQIGEREAFHNLYPTLFAPFWDKGLLKNTVAFSSDLIKHTSCFSLGFVNNKRVIDFVRRI